MVPIKIPEDITPQAYYGDYIFREFEEAKSKSPLSGVEGTILSVQIDINGPNGGTWTVIFRDAKEIVTREGPHEAPLLKMELSEEDWRYFTTGMIRPSVDVYDHANPEIARSVYEGALNIEGKVISRILKPDGDYVMVKVVFNGVESPEVIFTMNQETYTGIVTGEYAPKTAFLEGKLEIEGDMVLALKLGQLKI